jgi:hypothetical protein
MMEEVVVEGKREQRDVVIYRAPGEVASRSCHIPNPYSLSSLPFT